jgi:hypothetical protein
VLARAHERVADLITVQEAKAVMGEHAYWLDFEARMGHLHPLVKSEGSFHTYDATFLGEPPDEVRYARYEVEERKRVNDTIKEALERINDSLHEK